jgi:nicotinamidase-related amidase
MSAELPIPAHFNPVEAGILRRIPYQQLAADSETWAKKYDLQPAQDDEFRVALLGVDIQNTFCLPGFELFVAGRSGNGAVEDNCRLAEFIYRNLHRITGIIPTMDTHQALQIFHSVFLVNPAGRHPEPLTVIHRDDIEKGAWHVHPPAGRALGMAPEQADRYLQHYVETLDEGGKFALNIWPYHAMLGGVGHALAPVFEEAVFFHTLARFSPADFVIKGQHALTESYSASRPEVQTDAQGRPLDTHRENLFEKLLQYDAVLIAGQAKSHCVAWTVENLLSDILEKRPDFVKQIYLLEDCTSPVVVPGVIDFTEQADEAFQRFSEAGMHLVRSADPMDSWLEMR